MQRARATVVFMLLGVTLLSFFWFPRPFTPQWFREADMRRRTRTR